MKRFVYLILSITALLTAISFVVGGAIQSYYSEGGDMFISVVLGTVVAVALLAANFITEAIYDISSQNGQGPFTTYPFFIGFGTFRMKQIHHEIGDFYMTRRKSTIKVWRQTYLFMIPMFEVNFHSADTIEHLQNKIKKKLDKIYEDELRAKQEEQMRKNKIEKWDGCLDKQSRREHKLKKIL